MIWLGLAVLLAAAYGCRDLHVHLHFGSSEVEHVLEVGEPETQEPDVILEVPDGQDP